MPEFHYFEFDLFWICCTTSCATNSQQVERSTGVRWTSLQPDQNLRSPHVAQQQQQQLSIDVCRYRAPDLSSKPAGRRRYC